MCFELNDMDSFLVRSIICHCLRTKSNTSARRKMSHGLAVPPPQTLPANGPYSWGSLADRNGLLIKPDSSEVSLPSTAIDTDVALVSHECKQLRELDLLGCSRITDIALRYLPTELAHLNLHGCIVSDDGLKCVAERCRNLLALDLFLCDAITDRGLSHLKALKKLQMLKITSPLITRNGLLQLAELPDLSMGQSPGLEEFYEAQRRLKSTASSTITPTSAHKLNGNEYPVTARSKNGVS